VSEFWLARSILVLCLSYIFPYWRVLEHLLGHRHRLALIPSRLLLSPLVLLRAPSPKIQSVWLAR
jgi:hypothetical protein